MADVLAMIEQRGLGAAVQNAGGGATFDETNVAGSHGLKLPARRSIPNFRQRSPIFADRPLYGAPIQAPGLAYAPVNEMGVVLLFGITARELGFHVERVQTEFPDCEAMREVQPGKWQRVRIEFEYESRNFKIHGHPVNQCDVIVCWKHNWKECPRSVQVIELAEIFGN